MDWSVPALAAIATGVETLLAVGLILGIAAKLTARRHRGVDRLRGDQVDLGGIR